MSAPIAGGSERTGATAGRRPRHVTWLLVAGVGLAAINLRTAITSVGPVLDEISADLAMTPTVAGVLTTLPVLCFALFGALTPALIRRLGEHQVLLGALLALAVGLGVRALADDQWLFLAFSVLALSGGAAGNVLIPTLVKQHFPHRVGAMTTLYTTALALGSTMAAAGTVPMTEATGGNWHVAVGSYALFGLVAALPWALLLRHGPTSAERGETLGLTRVLRTAMGWQSVVFFGTQSMVAYIMFGWFALMLRDHGMSAAGAGLALSYLTALSVPVSLVLPGLMARTRDHRWFVVLFFLSYLAGFTGLLVAPVSGVWAWTTLIGIGMSTFPLALTFFAVRTRTAPGTAAMSASSQSIGYLMAGVGPFLFGLLHELTGAWHAPMAMLIVVAAVNLGVGLFLGRPGHLEDVLPAPKAP
ncbi:MFS transporter, CP family, cyanate transporter [Marinactinospora thermotolerans DSM 45154]|uniref:MFS transporter, CP family, cyanate transporter n=1 Tax=Marinactinospora thermotolerans DSM 45154 TaxID=1122192 RepID=A0A1T4KCI8_9ACTN|nr:MFS transporter, CP family, cyanate transporter [Marinactinospora thermotolerans DSM 45154]